MDAMLAGGFLDTHCVFWHRVDQNVATGTPDSYTYAVETCVLGYYGGRSTVKFRQSSSNPAERHNIISTPTHRDLYEYKGSVVNVHEKPISLAASFILSH